MKIQHASTLRGYSMVLTVLLAWVGLAEAQLPITNGLKLWLAANTGVVTSGSSVLSWLDLSGNGNSVTQNLASAQPSLVANAMLGLPVVRFDGTGDYLQSSNAINKMITASTYTAFAVFKLTGISRNSAVGYDNNAVFADSGGYFGMFVKNAASPTVYEYNYIGASDAAASAGAVTNKSLLVTSQHAGGVLSIATSLGGSSSSNSANTQVLTYPLMLSGGYNTTTADNHNFLNGDIAEILIYNTALTASQQGDIQEYLYSKWIIPEPTTAVLALLGLAGCYWRRLRYR